MMIRKCIMCGGKLEKKKIDHIVYEINLGKFPAFVCKCGEEYYDEETVNRMTKKGKQLGLLGLAKKTKISYSGKSLMVRIPKEIAKFAHLQKGKEVGIIPESREKILIEVKK